MSQIVGNSNDVVNQNIDAENDETTSSTNIIDLTLT